MPMLRWPHDNHRDVRARLNATILADRDADHDQNRYVMITFPTSQIQNADLFRWSSIRHDGARANARLRSQLVHRSSLLKADTCPRKRLLMPRTVVGQCTLGC